MSRVCECVREKSHFHVTNTNVHFPPVQTNTDLEPLYVVEVLVHCSKESVKNSATEAAKPAGPGETGEMQVGDDVHHIHKYDCMCPCGVK